MGHKNKPVFLKVLWPRMSHCWCWDWFWENRRTSLYITRLWHSLSHTLVSRIIQSRHMLLHCFHSFQSFWCVWNQRESMDTLSQQTSWAATVKIHLASLLKRIYLKWKNLLPLLANSFLLEKTAFQKDQEFYVQERKQEVQKVVSLVQSEA